MKKRWLDSKEEEVDVKTYRSLKKFRDELADMRFSIDDIGDKIDEMISEINSAMLKTLGFENYLDLELSEIVKPR